MTYEIQKEAGRYFIEIEGKVAAEMSFVDTGEKAMIIDSTYVEPAYRGHGLGRLLLDSVVARARAEKRRVMPLCTYAKAMFAKYPQYSDVSV